jgi:hypothetical protein
MPSSKPRLFFVRSTLFCYYTTAHIYTMPPRSVADATRFTPTGPHAFTRSSTPDSAAGGETPQERVARLREAARRAKVEKAAGSTFDRLVDRGRLWADRAHRVTAVGLIGATSSYPAGFTFTWWHTHADEDSSVWWSHDLCVYGYGYL